MTDTTASEPRTYRKRPVEIQAMRLTRENGPAVWEWADSKPFYEPDGTTSGLKITGLSINTLEGRMKADFGDWIIRGVKGEFYPCKPDVFELTYEPVLDVSDLGNEWAWAAQPEVDLAAHDTGAYTEPTTPMPPLTVYRDDYPHRPERDDCSCNDPCCQVDLGIGVQTCGSQHCPDHGVHPDHMTGEGVLAAIIANPEPLPGGAA